MNRTKTITILVILTLVGIMLASLSFAEEKDDEAITGTIALKQYQESDYPGLAKISLIEAVQAGLTMENGKALKAELENEDGYLVYSVEIVTPDKSIIELVIDAGSGKLLAKEQDKEDAGKSWDDDDDEGHEGHGKHEEEDDD